MTHASPPSPRNQIHPTPRTIQSDHRQQRQPQPQPPQPPSTATTVTTSSPPSSPPSPPPPSSLPHPLSRQDRIRSTSKSAKTSLDPISIPVDISSSKSRPPLTPPRPSNQPHSPSSPSFQSLPLTIPAYSTSYQGTSISPSSSLSPRVPFIRSHSPDPSGSTSPPVHLRFTASTSSSPPTTQNISYANSSAYSDRHRHPSHRNAQLSPPTHLAPQQPRWRSKMSSYNPTGAASTAAPSSSQPASVEDRQNRAGAPSESEYRRPTEASSRTNPPRPTSFFGVGLSEHPQYSQHHGSTHRSTFGAFDPLLQQLGDVKYFKEKSSSEFADDDGHLGVDANGRMRSESGPSASANGGGHTPAYTMFASGVPSSLSNDGSSHSGPSRTSTPFCTGETDYESAYETDAVGINRSRGTATAASTSLLAEQRDGSLGTSLKSIKTSGHEAWDVPGNSPPNSLDIDRDCKISPGWMAWLASAALPRSHRYQRLQNAETLKSPLMRHHYRTRSHNRPDLEMTMFNSSRHFLLWAVRSLQDFVASCHPAKIFGALLFVAGFVASTTLLIMYILNPDKEPLPWRTYCAEQQSFPHTMADSLAPVDVFVGVMTVDSHFERRSVIRSTYGAHTRPVDPVTGLQSSNVQLKFVLGKPKKQFERRIALEQEMFNDIVVLWDMEENMAGGKSWRYFKWATENATVPILRPHSESASTLTALPKQGTVKGADDVIYDVSWKLADYVVKADDDAFIALDELERHLRVAPRKLTYWGYLIKNWFMGGEAYAISMDLAQWIATSPWVLAHTSGKEDTQTAKWLKHHPEKHSINYVSERCWIYDHPKSGTPYAHGYLFPDEVERIKREKRVGGLSAQEISRRGGEHAAQWYSTVNTWKVKYKVPRADMSIEEEIEALVEGGGIYHDSGYKSNAGSSAEQWAPWKDVVYEADDGRLLRGGGSKLPGHLDPPARMSADWHLDPSSGLPIYGSSFNNSSPSSYSHYSRGEVESQHESHRRQQGSNGKAASHAKLVRRGSGPMLGSPPSATSGDLRARDLHVGSEGEILRETNPPHRVPRPQYAGHLPAPAGKTGVVDLRRLIEERYLLTSEPSNLPSPPSSSSSSVSSQQQQQQHPDSQTGQSSSSSSVSSQAQQQQQQQPWPVLRGGTVVVHYLKHDEWFYETALALVGRDRIRSSQAGAGAGVTASNGGIAGNGRSGGWGTQFTMWGSPDSHARGSLA